MNRLAKFALGALMLGGMAAATTAPADAGVAVGVTVGVPGVAVGYHTGNPCFRPFAYRPAYCGYPVYSGPIYVGGVVYQGPAYYRVYGGARQVWFNGGWHAWNVGWHDRDDVRFHDRVVVHHDWR
jgi:hypothetical protein